MVPAVVFWKVSSRGRVQPWNRKMWYGIPGGISCLSFERSCWAVVPVRSGLSRKLFHQTRIDPGLNAVHVPEVRWATKRSCSIRQLDSPTTPDGFWAGEEVPPRRLKPSVFFLSSG